jgi:hypothetical protein
MNQNEKLYRVIKSYTAVYPDPITVRAGDEIMVGEEDTEFPGWVWCSDQNGKSGWLPLDCIEHIKRNSGAAKYDYSAIELNAGTGEKLKSNELKNGWAWCVNESGQSGWIPLDHLEAGI